jgi:hypothetical protein
MLDERRIQRDNPLWLPGSACVPGSNDKDTQEWNTPGDRKEGFEQSVAKLWRSDSLCLMPEWRSPAT